jgi:hypothetical protein
MDARRNAVRYGILRVREWMIGEIGHGAPDARYVKLSLSTVNRAMRSSFGI